MGYQGKRGGRPTEKVLGQRDRSQGAQTGEEERRRSHTDEVRCWYPACSEVPGRHRCSSTGVAGAA